MLRCIALYAAYSIVAIMFDEMFPLWALTSLHKGGLQLHTSDIGKLFALNGLFLVLFQVRIQACDLCTLQQSVRSIMRVLCAVFQVR
jgi:hypothetical protein